MNNDKCPLKCVHTTIIRIDYRDVHIFTINLYNFHTHKLCVVGQNKSASHARFRTYKMGKKFIYYNRNRDRPTCGLVLVNSIFILFGYYYHRGVVYNTEKKIIDCFRMSVVVVVVVSDL